MAGPELDRNQPVGSGGELGPGNVFVMVQGVHRALLRLEVFHLLEKQRDRRGGLTRAVERRVRCKVLGKEIFCDMAVILEAEAPEILLFSTLEQHGVSSRLNGVLPSANDPMTWNVADWTLDN